MPSRRLLISFFGLLISPVMLAHHQLESQNSLLQSSLIAPSMLTQIFFGGLLILLVAVFLLLCAKRK